jgi:hypothetical protein
MPRVARVLVVLTGLVAIAAVVASIGLLGPSLPAASDAPGRHALLIGIDDYSGTSLRSLEGPANDVELTRALLESRFGVPARNITTLVDAQATHSGIRKAFADLSARVGPGDFVYIQYSGHGSYTADKNGDEPSGQDQTWVSFGARSGRLPGDDDHDVLDDEVSEWLVPLYARTDQVVFVSDSCHSASVSRGELRGVRAAPVDPRAHPLAAKKFKSAVAPGVRVGAARDTESAIEMRKAGKSYGLFTWYWVEALNQVRPGETWDEVFRRVYARVTTQRGALQRPQIEGEGNRTVFGGETIALTPTVAVTRVDEQARTVEVQTGAVHGATERSVYRLHTPGFAPGAGRAATLQLTRVRAYASEGLAREGSFKVGDLVAEVEHAYPFEPLRVAVEADYPAQDGALVGRIERALESLAGFRLVAGRGDADWVARVLRPLRTGGGYVQAVGATLPDSAPDADPEVWVLSPQEELLNRWMRVPFEDPEKGLETLEENLRRFARVREIKRLASSAGPPAVTVTVTQRRVAEPCPADCVELPDESGKALRYARVGTSGLDAVATLAPREGDVLTFAVRNDADRPRYVYLLNIGPDGAISAIFPLAFQAAEHARFDPGKTRDLSAEAGLLLNAPGEETVKVIASASPIDVRLFEAEGYATLVQTRGTELNPLERLLAEAIFTRGQPVSIRQEDWGTLQAAFPVVE